MPRLRPPFLPRVRYRARLAPAVRSLPAVADPDRSRAPRRPRTDRAAGGPCQLVVVLVDLLYRRRDSAGNHSQTAADDRPDDGADMAYALARPSAVDLLE